HDPVLQKIRASAVNLHPRVVVALDGQHVDVAEMLDQMARHAPEVCRVTNAAAEAVNHKPVRAIVVMRQADRMNLNMLERRKPARIESLNHRSQLSRDAVIRTVAHDACQQIGLPILVTEYGDSQATERVAQCMRE